MSEFDSDKLAAVRAGIAHPVIDSDGHIVEFLPAVREELISIAGTEMADQLDTVLGASKMARDLDADTRRQLGLFRLSWWAFPTAGTLDRATGLLPGLLAERLPDLGIDFAVLYPTLGLTVPHLDDPDLRRAACRAFNSYYANACAPYAEVITPAAIVPMHTPEEALEELAFAVETLGLKTVVLAGHVARPIPGAESVRAARWIDSFGPDDPKAYDAVWQRCQELGVAPTFHSSAMGWGSRASLSNYVYNHIGNFAVGGEATCRSLFLSGVPGRFPELRFAFLEGGVAWGANLYADLVSHYEKRGGAAIDQFNPKHVDLKKMRELFARYGSEQDQRHTDQLESALQILSDPSEAPEGLDEFRHTEISGAESIARVFRDQFFFGCEADDPMNAVAFQSAVHPMQIQFRALFSSDIGHWDVPDMRLVLLEAWELVERELLDRTQFRQFTFENAVALFGGVNPAFFDGTRIADEVRSELALASTHSGPEQGGALR